MHPLFLLRRSVFTAAQKLDALTLIPLFSGHTEPKLAGLVWAGSTSLFHYDVQAQAQFGFSPLTLTLLSAQPTQRVSASTHSASMSMSFPFM